MKFLALIYNLLFYMKIHFTIVVLLFCLVSAGKAGVDSKKDSIGIERINGKIFILHKVEAKETFYSLSRRYKVTIEDIIRYNPEAEAGLKLEEILKIPYQQGETNNSALKKHTVAPGQTLFAISKLNNVSVEDIKKWNNLSSNDLNVGQTLIMSAESKSSSTVSPSQNQTKADNTNNTGSAKENNLSGKVAHAVEPSQTLFSISKIYNVAVEDIKSWNNLQGNDLEVGQKLTIKVKREANKFDDSERIPVITENVEQDKVTRLNNKVEPVVKENPVEVANKETKPETKTTNSSGFKKVVELGLAEIIENASDTKKYVALHRTAPIGTIMQVTNEMNNQNVFVRVIGKLPATGVNEKVLIKLSRPAFERLGAVNDKFPAEISYVP